MILSCLKVQVGLYTRFLQPLKQDIVLYQWCCAMTLCTKGSELQHAGHYLCELNHLPRFHAFERMLGHSCKWNYPIKSSFPDVATGGILSKVRRKLGLLEVSKMRLMASAVFLYEACVDDVNISTFFTRYQLPDTFLSWFLVMELHVWMCLVRVMKEGDKGRFVRNKVVEAMWKDVDMRLSKLGESSAAKKREGKKELLSHFQASLFSYDEGLLSDDKILAAAIWRILFCYSCTSPILLEELVHYVRKQVDYLDSQSSEAIITKGKLQWAPLSESLCVRKFT
ncbi:ubiquinol-cytochrome-c reductase complex assembly factor 1-like [Limulus polyphemus]|uniref:Ubiquinol-cytochrome-c reductase complex assembly factor 1-like n=1 Tax=Limulus polyphemus TaxID=6850 RepID=A0ABM1B481_LIMPO|nr:ubiquinol-cytochrome-c reductase complex assembly factor 1-like [Limulus polyphemus]XP_013774483.1 ubiquinol-cytochrome-c reductase complex assembly factor 1-like [Limulus polyphemus]XP_022241719.1 ubiquinol-cytochrome-c reductase complex assembly factor 1-like [Limulus polyphemus]